MSRWHVTIDGTYGYSQPEPNVNLAIRRALDEHNRRAKAAKAAGRVVPVHTWDLARKRGLSVRVERIVPKAEPKPTAAERRRRVRRTLLMRPE